VEPAGTVFMPQTAEERKGTLTRFKKDVTALVKEYEKLPDGLQPFATSVCRDRWLLFGTELELKLKSKQDYLRPVPLLVELAEQLRSVGVEFIYVPITPKWAIYPDAISDAAKPDAEGRIPRVNPEGRVLFEALQDKGVTAIDLTEPFVRERYGKHGPVHFRHDTHWSPAGMEVAARAVANVIRTRAWYRSIPKQHTGMKAEWGPGKRDSTGDLGNFIGGIYGDDNPMRDWPIENPDVRYISGIDLRDDALVVVIGDSNIAAFPYDFNFSAQLAYELGIQVDEVATAVEGCRRDLGRKFARHPECLFGKKVVIWLHTGRDMGGQFADAVVVGEKHPGLYAEYKPRAAREETLAAVDKPDALWPLNDPWGPIARDVSGNARNGLYEPGVIPTLGAGPDFSVGRMFADLPKGSDYALGIWVRHSKPEAAAGIWGIADARNPELLGDSLTLESAALRFAGGTGTTLAGRTKLDPDTWHHVLVVRQGNRVAVYLDGKEELSGKAPHKALKTPRLYVGGTAANETRPWRGRLAEACFFARALPPAEIDRHFKTWIPSAAARDELTVEIDPAAGLDSVTLRVDDFDLTPQAETRLTRIIRRTVGRNDRWGETLTLNKLAPGTLDLDVEIEFTPLGGISADTARSSLKVIANPATVDTDVVWTGGGVLPSGRTAGEWWRGRNWKGGKPPVFDTDASIIFESDAPNLGRLARDRGIGGLTARSGAAGHTVDLDGTALTVRGDLSVDLPSDDQPFAVTGGTLRLGDKKRASRIRVKNGALRLDAKLDMPNVDGILLPDDGGENAVLTVSGDGTLAAGRLHLASEPTDGPQTASLAVPRDSRLKAIAVRDSLRIAAGDTAAERTALENGYDAGGGQWVLADGTDITVGGTDRAAALVAIGHGRGGSKKGSLIAGSGGKFSAHVELLQVGAMSGPGTGWDRPPRTDADGPADASEPEPETAAIKAESIDPNADTIKVAARAMALDTKRDKVDVKSIEVTGALNTSSGTLVINGPGLVAADTFHIASPGRATLVVPRNSPLKKLIVRDSFRMACGGNFATSLLNGYHTGGTSWLLETAWGKRKGGEAAQNWTLPGGISFEIGTKDKPASEFKMGTGGGWSSRASLVAGTGGVFTAHVALMELAALDIGGGNWWNAMQPECKRPVIGPYSVGADQWGILDLSRIERCDITVDRLRVGHATVASWGAQVVGQMRLPDGNVTAGSITIGSPFPVCKALQIGDEDWDGDAFRIGTEGRLELNGTRCAVSGTMEIFNTGVVDTRLSDASAGLDLAEGATLTIDGKGTLSIVFEGLPKTAGLYYGLRWAGDHRQPLEKLLDAGRIVLDIGALGPDAGKPGVFTAEERVDGTKRLYTYVGFRNAPDRGGNSFWGTLDISRMARCDISAEKVEIGHTTVKSWGTQLKGALLLPAGTVRAETVFVGHEFPVSDEHGSAAFRSGCEGRLGLYGTTFMPGKNITVHNTGVIETRVSGTSAGLDLAADTELSVTRRGGLNIVFESLPKTAGLYYGLRWAGNHRSTLEKLVASGVIAVTDDPVRAEAGKAGVFAGKENGARFTYIGFPNAPKAKPVARPAKPAVTGTKPETTKPEEKPQPAALASKDGKITVLARITIVSKPPVPRKEPYTDALTTTQYKVLKIEGRAATAKEFLAIEPVMTNYTLLPSAKYKIGDVHRLALIPWEDKIAKEPKLKKVHTVDDTDNYEADIFWVESWKAGRQGGAVK